jgi:hypothetical protein
LTGLAGTVGCQTTVTVPPGTLPDSFHIEVRQSDSVNRFAVLECVPSVPAGTEIDLYRGSTMVARVVMTESRRGGYGIATWLTGEPAAGDWGRIVQTHEKERIP